MARNYTFGGLGDGAFWAENLKLPLISGTDATDLMSDLVDQAATERKGVVIMGRGGCGKTIATEQARREFERIEEAAEKADATHVRKRLHVIHSPKTSSRYDLINVVWETLFGMPYLQPRGRRKKPEDLLFKELVDHLLDQNVAVLVFDVGENLSYEGLTFLEDIIALAEERSPGRFSGDEYAAAGVGVVLSGTLRLKTLILRSKDVGRRWVRVEEVQLLQPTEVAETYLTFLPGLKAHVKKISRKRWNEFVRVHVAGGEALPIGWIENHVRNYVRHMADSDKSLKALPEVGWNEDLFLLTLDHLRGAGDE